MWTHPGKKLLFMGGDFGQWNEWNFDHSLQWDLLQWDSHQGLQKCVADLNRLLRQEKALHEVDFDCQRLRVDRLPQLRRQHAELPAPGKGPQRLPGRCLQLHARACGEHYRLGVPEACWYQEIFNSDSMFYGGSNLGNCPRRDGREYPQPRPSRLDHAHACRRWPWWC